MYSGKAIDERCRSGSCGNLESRNPQRKRDEDPQCQSRPISSGGYALAPQIGLIDVRILIFDIIGLQFHVARIVFAVVDIRIKTNRDSTAAAIIQADPPFNVISDRECNLGKK